MKRFISLVMTAMLIITSAPNSAKAYFADTNEHWAEESINSLNSMGVMSGDGVNAFPDEYITRAEFAKLVAGVFLQPDETNFEQYFDDVPANSVFAPYIAAAYKSGIVNGVGNNNFSPNGYVTREEIVLMIARIDIIPDISVSVKFYDIPNNYKYAKELKKVLGNGIVKGFDDGAFYPHGKATRAQAAAMIMRALRCADVSSSPKKEFVRQIIISNFEDLQYLSECSIGAAYDDTIYRMAVKNGQVSASVLSASQISSSTTGMITVVEYACTVEYRAKNYRRILETTVICNFLKKGERYKVYDINTRIYETDEINLAWDISAQTPTSLPNGLTHISPSAYIVSDENQYGSEIKLPYSPLNIYNRLNDKYVEKSHDSGIKVWAMYKTDFKPETANSFLNNSYAANTAIVYLQGECLRTGIEGINLDFENMYRTDAAAYANHVKKLTLAMHDIGVIVSADITRYEKTSSQWSMCYDRDRLAEYADYIMIMAYDQYYAGSKTPGPVASMQWTEDTVILTLGEVAAERLILGIPFYVRYWETTNGKVTSTKAISMQAAQNAAAENKATISYSETDGTDIAIWQKNDTVCQMWLENAQSTAKRKNLAKKYGLSGTAAWRLGLETADIWDN